MVSKKQGLTGGVAISLAAVLWGLDGVVLTPRLHHLPIDYVVFVFHMIPFLLMSVIFRRQFRYITQFNRSDYLFITLIALFGGALGTLSIVKALFLVGFKKLSIVVLLQKLQPVFGIMLAALILKERMAKKYLLWASLAIVGGYFLAFGLKVPRIEADNDTLLAAGFALLAAFSFGSSTVFSKKILYKYSFFTATFYRYGFTAVLMLVVVAANGNIGALTETSSTQWIYFLIIAFTTGSGAIYLYYFGLRRVKAMVATICELFFPISAVLFDYIFNDYQLSMVQCLSAVVMIFAIVQLNRQNDRRKKEA
jgi:drug/metabolite transporter (DMT)-like permease